MIIQKITSLGQKQTETPYFFIVMPYCGSVIHNSLVYEFLRVLKFFKFSLKICRLAYSFTENRQFEAKPDQNSDFFIMTPILRIGYP
jgi:hypothetical protein